MGRPATTDGHNPVDLKEVFVPPFIAGILIRAAEAVTVTVALKIVEVIFDD